MDAPAPVDRTNHHGLDERLQLQTDILRNVRDAVVVTDLAGRITYWNEGATRLFGYEADEMIGSTPAKVYPGQSMGPDDLAEILEGGEFLGEWQGRRRDGSAVWVSVRASTMRDAADRPIGVIGVATDVSERRATLDRLARLEAAVEQTSDSVVIANARAEIEYVNPAFERVSGYRRAEVIGKNPRILKSGDQNDAFYHAMWASLTAGQPWVADFTNRRRDGSTFEEEATISPIRDEAGEITGFVAVKRDVTAERKLQTRAELLLRERVLIAETIRGITGRETPEETADAICRQVASMADVATAGLFIFELDGRTAPYGFTAASGEAPYLRRVPRRRTDYLRERAEHGPWIEPWGDRPWHPYNEVLMQHGVRGIAYAPVRNDGIVIGFLHISSAVDDWQHQLTEQLPSLVEFAEIAAALIGARVAERTQVERARASIRRIVREAAYHPVFQPIVDLRTGEAVGYEALTRFADGIAPDVRFAEALEIGMSEQLEMATLAAAIEAARDLPASTWLNINVSPRLVLAGAPLHRILGSTPRPIVLEITEHTAIADYDAFRRAINDLGPSVRLAIDDAGAGYSSLQHILELAPAFVKLDRSIVTGLESDRARSALVAGMITLRGPPASGSSPRAWRPRRSWRPSVDWTWVSRRDTCWVPPHPHVMSAGGRCASATTRSLQHRGDSPLGDDRRCAMHRFSPDRDLYEVLQVHPRAHPQVITAAYRALARMLHPDYAGDDYDRQRSAAGTEAKPVTAAVVPPESARSRGTVLPHGRYAGWALGDLVRHDSDYLRWLQRHPSGRRYRAEIERLLAGAVSPGRITRR